jgi:hypothetical protein
MSVYFWTDEERREFLISCGVKNAGTEKSADSDCDICNTPTKGWDMHMIFFHPETRIKPARVAAEKKKRKKR